MSSKPTMQVGDCFGRLTVVELISDRKNPLARCACICGGESISQRGSLRSGKTQSCGCLKVEAFRALATTHGRSRSAAYSRWTNVLDRCRNPANKSFHNYGGRGIAVEWPTFEAFYADMGEPPAGAWLEREDNNGPYSKTNCIWASPKKNSENKRVSKTWTINGETFTSAPGAARRLGVDTSVIIRGCNGYMRGGIWHPPREGWSAVLKYGGAK